MSLAHAGRNCLGKLTVQSTQSVTANSEHKRIWSTGDFRLIDCTLLILVTHWSNYWPIYAAQNNAHFKEVIFGHGSRGAH